MPAKNKPKPVSWEYHIEEGYWDTDDRGYRTDSYVHPFDFDALGSEGWELVAVQNHQFYFKRQLVTL